MDDRPADHNLGAVCVRTESTRKSISSGIENEKHHQRDYYQYQYYQRDDCRSFFCFSSAFSLTHSLSTALMNAFAVCSELPVFSHLVVAISAKHSLFVEVNLSSLLHIFIELDLTVLTMIETLPLIVATARKPHVFPCHLPWGPRPTSPSQHTIVNQVILATLGTRISVRQSHSTTPTVHLETLTPSIAPNHQQPRTRPSNPRPLPSL